MKCGKCHKKATHYVLVKTFLGKVADEGNRYRELYWCLKCVMEEAAKEAE